jgi:hypothetical protein
MADVKISGLPASTTPLAGTEVLPVVQGGATKQVSVANLTAGRAVSAASLALTTTPLPVASGGTGLTTLTVNYIPYGNGTSAFASSANLNFNGSFLNLLGTSAFGASAVRRSSFYFESANRALTATTANLAIGVTDAFGTDVGGQIALSGKYDGTADQIPFGIIKGAKENANSGNLAGYLAFGTSTNAGGFAEAMRISSNQGVSIGNTTDKGAGSLNVSGLIYPQQATTAAAPAYQKGAIYFDTTLNKLRVGGATAWETITSV